MHSLVLGPGALGLLFAARLAALGEVTLIGRDSHQGPFKGEVRWSDGSSTPMTLPRIGPDQTLPDPVSLLMVTTKAQHSLEALRPLLPTVPATVPVVLCQNGMGSQQAVADAFPQRPILAATTTEGANRSGPGRVVHAGAGETWLGPLTDSAGEQAPWLADRLREAGFEASACRNIQERLWQKLAVNAGINPFTALLDVPNGQLPRSAFFRERIGPLCREISAVAREEGFVMTPEALETRILAVCHSTSENISSMLQDIRAGKPSEIDFINGYIVRRAQALGIATPVNRELVSGVMDLL
ncbi:MAG: 2-dehydropantoate 2-reductase [Oleiphilaceae bacterium]|nr:2-dehydropantoate 2-reductase [Oleiphilaceae bacterium]